MSLECRWVPPTSNALSYERRDARVVSSPMDGKSTATPNSGGASRDFSARSPFSTCPLLHVTMSETRMLKSLLFSNIPPEVQVLRDPEPVGRPVERTRLFMCFRAHCGATASGELVTTRPGPAWAGAAAAPQGTQVKAHGRAPGRLRGRHCPRVASAEPRPACVDTALGHGNARRGSGSGGCFLNVRLSYAPTGSGQGRRLHGGAGPIAKSRR